MAGGDKKYGRNDKRCERYRARGHRERNKERRVAKFEAMVAESQERHLLPRTEALMPEGLTRTISRVRDLRWKKHFAKVQRRTVDSK